MSVYLRYEGWESKNGDLWTSGILSNTKDIELPESPAAHTVNRTGITEINQENVMAYQSEQTTDYIMQVADAIKKTGCVILIDLVGNDVWFVNDVKEGNPSQINMNTIMIDKNAFPEGCKDLAGMFAL